MYVDEWSEAFQGPHLEAEANVVTFQAREAATANPNSGGEYRKMLLDAFSKLSTLNDEPPAYRKRWNLATDEKFEEGVIYMASLNRQQPAAWVMLGIASVTNGDFNLAAAAYQRAIDLGGPQSQLVRAHLQQAKRVARIPDRKPNAMLWGLIAAGGLPVLVPLALWYLFRGRRLIARRRARGIPSLPFGGS